METHAGSLSLDSLLVVLPFSWGKFWYLHFWSFICISWGSMWQRRFFMLWWVDIVCGCMLYQSKEWFSMLWRLGLIFASISVKEPLFLWLKSSPSVVIKHTPYIFNCVKTARFLIRTFVWWDNELWLTSPPLTLPLLTYGNIFLIFSPF